MNNRFCTDKPDQNLRYYIIPKKCASANSEPVFIRNVCGFPSIILLQTRQGFLTQSAAKFAEKTCAYACEDGFSHIKSKISAKITAYIFFIKDNTITANPKKQKANRNLLSR